MAEPLVGNQPLIRVQEQNRSLRDIIPAVVQPVFGAAADFELVGSGEHLGRQRVGRIVACAVASRCRALPS